MHKDLLVWRLYRLKNYLKAVYEIKILKHKTYPNKWAGKTCLSLDETNNQISQAILVQKPFMAARFGGTEMRAILIQEELRITGHVKENSYEEIKHLIKIYSGMFSNTDEGFNKFCNKYKEEALNADVLGIWYSEQEEYLLKKYGKNAAYTKLENLEPYYVESMPWTRALAGKKVLVIHPFSESIEKQYLNREYIWENEEVLPKFELITYRAIQTLCGEDDPRFSNWFEALEYMINDIKEIDFEVAIIGCGAYGLPLASFIKNMGKQAIHLAGATQILFGIYGKRWEDNPFFTSRINQYWVKPLESERPKRADEVEGACYW